MKNSQSSPVILVLEEDQELRDGIAALLSADGYRVVAARGQEEAILRARHVRPNLILASVSGSVDETLAAARNTREQAECDRETPIVIFSVDKLPEGAEIEIAEKMYLTRPDNFNQLRRLLRRIVFA